MNVKMLCALAAPALVALVAQAALTFPSGQGNAGSCQRQVWIDPQVSAAESAGTLTFTVHTRGCAAAGHVSYVVAEQSARRPADFTAGNGQLQWGGGDGTARQITVQVAPDSLPEPAIEDLTITLTNPSPAVTVEVSAGHGRILDDDTGVRTMVIDDQSCPSPGALVLPQAVPSLLRLCPMDNGNITHTIVRNFRSGPLDAQYLTRGPITQGGGVSFASSSYVAHVTVAVPSGFTGQYGIEIVQVSHGVTVIDPSAVGDVRA